MGMPKQRKNKETKDTAEKLMYTTLATCMP